MSAKRRIVLGLGNTLNRDEGMGVHALKVLEKRLGNRATDIELLDGGVLGLNLLIFVEDASHLLILDAVNANQPAGTVIELSRDEIPLYNGIRLSQHQVTFQEVLWLAKIRDKMPAFLHLIGTQPGDISTGVEMSPEVEHSLADVAERAERILMEWQLITP